MSQEKSTLHQGRSALEATIPMFQRPLENRPKPWASFENYCRASGFSREANNINTPPPTLLGPLPMAMIAGPKMVSTPDRVYTATLPLSDVSNRYLPTPSPAVVPSSGVYSVVLGQWVPPKYVSSKQRPVEDQEMKKVPLSKTLSESDQENICARFKAAEITQEEREERTPEKQQVVTLAPEPAVPIRDQENIQQGASICLTHASVYTSCSEISTRVKQRRKRLKATSEGGRD